MVHIGLILSENNIIIEEIVCRNTCFECNYTKWSPFLVSTKKHHVQQNVHNTVLLSYTFCTDIIFSLGKMGPLWLTLP
jgi:hypothetical protein